MKLSTLTLKALKMDYHVDINSTEVRYFTAPHAGYQISQGLEVKLPYFFFKLSRQKILED